MDTSDPGITFDSAGVCSHCHRYDTKFRDVVDRASRGERLEHFDRQVSTIKADGRGKQYDCIVGVSGGVDSTFVLLKAVEAGLRPLAVHFDSGWNSELAVSNIENATTKLGVDLKTDVVNWPEMRDLQIAFLRSGVENCDIPTDHAFSAVALKNAFRYRVKYIMSGSNNSTESVLPTAWGHNAADRRYLKAIHRSHGTIALKTYPALGIVKKEIWYRYLCGIKTVKPLNDLHYVKSDAKMQISRDLGWRDYGGKHYESVFTRFFQGCYLPIRFGYDKRLAHLSSLILSHQVERSEALLELADNSTYPDQLRQSDKRFVAKKLGLSVDDLEMLMKPPTEIGREYPSNEKAYRIAFNLREFWSRRWVR